MLNGTVTLNELADRLGIDRSSARKIALRYGFVPARRQIEGLGRRQRMLVWTESDANQIIARRRADGFLVNEPT